MVVQNISILILRCCLSVLPRHRAVTPKKDTEITQGVQRMFLEVIEFGIFKLCLILASKLYVFTYYFGWILSLISGLLLPIIYFDKPDKVEDDSVLRRALIALALVLIPIGVFSNFTIPYLIKFIQEYKISVDKMVQYPFYSIFNFPIFLGGIGLHIFFRRRLTPLINKLKIASTKKTKLMRDERTDVRTIKEFLPKSIDYDPLDYIDLKKGVFVGLDVNSKPQYIPLETLQKQHLDAIGTTGAGKGVAVGLVLYQLIGADEGVFVQDPKNDEWAPHLMKAACDHYGKPFYLIDLNKHDPQLDLLAGATPEQVEELLVAGFSLAEKGDLADFYRIDDRKAARKAPQLATEEELKTLASLFNTPYVQGLQETVKAFYGKLEEMSLVGSINAEGGLNLKDVFDSGGCCYIIGSIRNAKVLIAQKMILLRIYQLAESRDRVNGKPRPIAIFLDELKYHISRAVLEGLGAIRDKGVHILMAHQSVADLRDCPADLNGDAVVGSVVENSKNKIVYKIQDPETAKWVADMSGTILVDDETRRVETSKSLTENVDGTRSIKLAERNFVDSNMLMNLPEKVSFIFTASEIAKSSVIQPVKVKKKALSIYSPFVQESISSPLDESDVNEVSEPIETESLIDDSSDLDLDMFVVSNPSDDDAESIELDNSEETFTAEEEADLLAELEKQIEGL